MTEQEKGELAITLMTLHGGKPIRYAVSEPSGEECWHVFFWQGNVERYLDMRAPLADFAEMYCHYFNIPLEPSDV